MYFITLFLFCYLFFCVCYLLFFSIAGRVWKERKYAAVVPKKRFAVIIPSYKEDAVILHTARNARAHDYPGDKFEVFVAADQLQQETIEQLRAIPVEVMVMDFHGKSSKAKSLNAVINLIPEQSFDAVIILDGDNIMAPGCLEKANAAMQNGYQCVQMHRTAKNTDNAVAVLDGISEEINNSIFRRGFRSLGFSPALIGSGMVFDFVTIKNIFNLSSILENPGEDREVDAYVIKKGIKIEYLEDAHVYDEKVSKEEHFEKQRIRWMEAQLKHINIIFSKNYIKGKRTADFWNRMLLVLIPPRSLMLLFYLMFIPFSFLSTYLKSEWVYPSVAYWMISFLLLLLSLILAVPRTHLRAGVLKEVFSKVFQLMLHMVKALFSLKRNRKEFIHTPKEYRGSADA